MKIGVVYPQIELNGDPGAVRLLGQAAEDLDFDHLLAYDHVVGAVHADRSPPLAGPYTERDPFHDPLVLFAYLAGRTERLRFATGVLILPQRQTVLVARQVADLDLLSGERVAFLGVGVGWNPVEYEALGQDFRTRGAREDEQIELLRTLFTEPVVDFTGRFDRVDRAALLPKPTRSVPIWLGGFSQAAHERAARLGDGFIFVGGDLDATIDTWGRMRQRVDELGRPVDEFGGHYITHLGNSVERLVDEVGRWREAGGTHVSVSTMEQGLDTAEAHAERFAAAAEALDPAQPSG